MNFHKFKLVLEKAEESEIKLPISVGSQKAREFHKSIYFCFIDYAKAFDYVDHNKLWKIFKRWEYLRNFYAGQEATVRTSHGTWTGSNLGKEYVKVTYYHSAY